MRYSICMTTYNGEKYLADQLESILCQMLDGGELIIMDDASSDKTCDILREVEKNDSRVKIFFNTTNLGHIENFSNALRECLGDLIFLCDQDDVWASNKIEKTIDYLDRNPKTFCLISDAEIIDKDGTTISESFFSKMNSGSGFAKNFVKNTFLGCCMVFRREILDVALPFPPGLHSHDTWLGLISECFGETKFFKDKLIKYRRHDSNASPLKRFGIRKIFQMRIFLAYHLLTRLTSWHIKRFSYAK